MIHGIGTDLVQLRRMREALERHGERFALRILAASEVEAWRAHRDPARFLAKRFAAKEALGKAFGCGVRDPVLLPDIAVEHDALGKPFFSYSPRLAAHLAERALTAHLSISDEQDYAVAFVILEKP